MGRTKAERTPEVVSLGNPFGLNAIFSIMVMVAKVLKTLGIIDMLEEKAEATESECDDKLIKITRNVLDTLAK